MPHFSMDCFMNLSQSNQAFQRGCYWRMEQHKLYLQLHKLWTNAVLHVKLMRQEVMWSWHAKLLPGAVVNMNAWSLFTCITLPFQQPASSDRWQQASSPQTYWWCQIFRFRHFWYLSCSGSWLYRLWSKKRSRFAFPNRNTSAFKAIK